MNQKSRLQTVRFSQEEGRLIERYLKENQIFDGFSALARVATLSFVGQGQVFHLQPVSPEKRPKRLPFLWDYDLTEGQIREVLRRPGLDDQKLWLTERILSQARFDEVIEYLSLKDIEKALPKVRMPPRIREWWEHAIRRWKGQNYSLL